MARVLIPFADPDHGERAVRQVLAEPPDPGLEVLLLAVVEPLVPGKVSLYLSRARAESLCAAAAVRWLHALEATLDAARVPHKSEVALGRPADVIARAARERDVDRVVLGTHDRRLATAWLRGRRSRGVHGPQAVVG